MTNLSRMNFHGAQMNLRYDGRETRERLLNAACEVFAEKGYRDATIAAICKRAGVNVALVNYYFGDKAKLYVETWQYAFEKKCCGQNLPEIDGFPPKKQLYLYVLSMLEHFLDEGEQGWFTRLYLMELANPTGLIHDIWHGLIEPKRRTLIQIICRLMGKEEVDENVLFCELSIINQCRSLLTIRRQDLEYLLTQPLSKELVNRLADHIARFSLAGIQEVAHTNHLPL
ncbi:MAG: CerR family C-terminal domain-containing protein [Dissulfuribacterales bacterium]